MSDTAVRGRRLRWPVRAVAAVRARAVAPVEPGVRDRGAWVVHTARLPVWPLTAMFGCMPLWWALGAFQLAWPCFGVLLFVLLTTRGRIRLPAGTTVWLVFLGIVAVSAVRLNRPTALATFSLRLGMLVTAFLVGLYVYNLARDRVPWARVAAPVCVYWVAVVALGWLGVLAPRFSAASPVELALPVGLAAQPFLQDLTHLDATEFNPYSANPIYRPAAPYPYTNNWGTGLAFLVPFVLAYLTAVRRGPLRLVLLISLPLSLVPAFLTLNRGMFIGLGAGVLYLLGREIARGRVRLLLPVAVILLVGWLVTLIIPVVDLIRNRTSTTDTNIDRYDLYVQTWAAVLHSPLLGYGQPTSVDTTHSVEPLGTQGLLWQLLYSYGIPAAACYYLLLLVVARRLSAAVSASGLWLSALPVIAAVITPFYGYVDPNMSVLFAGVGLGLAAVDGAVNRDPGVPR
ncbi:O-antigen ligase-like membrane protein [Krasilnikovia cinnamomea]|uniref:O-antigen ligase-like membrane protein n=1 Tax=Krasilnikovia cinnamomea TaxID=349313 RepID=A0A4Q7ZEV8_9ACTN|nr:O-antigen ligase family protein [Krasilnikovia cinnamomea]RZU49282.1 O-antigen ligase-like membrane protein [Krasilnikovia cinnamomea]